MCRGGYRTYSAPGHCRCRVAVVRTRSRRGPVPRADPPRRRPRARGRMSSPASPSALSVPSLSPLSSLPESSRARTNSGASRELWRTTRSRCCRIGAHVRPETALLSPLLPLLSSVFAAPPQPSGALPSSARHGAVVLWPTVLWSVGSARRCRRGPRRVSVGLLREARGGRARGSS